MLIDLFPSENQSCTSKPGITESCTRAPSPSSPSSNFQDPKAPKFAVFSSKQGAHLNSPKPWTLNPKPPSETLEPRSPCVVLAHEVPEKPGHVSEHLTTRIGFSVSGSEFRGVGLRELGFKGSGLWGSILVGTGFKVFLGGLGAGLS